MTATSHSENDYPDYVIRVGRSLADVPAPAWDGLLAAQAAPTPFMRHAYLMALEYSGSATAATGWDARPITLWLGDTLHAAAVLYIKDHSFGEYVFDWAWARAYAEHRVPYYPKGVIAVPFTPVPGSRLLAVNPAARQALVRAIEQVAQAEGLSSLHLLFMDEADRASTTWMPRSNVQFHWTNRTPEPWRDMDDFLQSLKQDKRKKIRQERRKVTDADVRFDVREGTAITQEDWAFFYRCYAQTYQEHGNPPYLTPAFFEELSRTAPQMWVMFVAMQGSEPVASSLIAISHASHDASTEKVAYGRYWGALQRVDCLHFEACYYQPIEWCIAHGYARFEGGAQGEHKMARALLPTPAHSAHWLAHPAFAQAVERFLQREREGVAGYLDDLNNRLPLKTEPSN